LGLGAFGYIYTSNALKRDMFAFVAFIGTFPTIFFLMLSPTSKEDGGLKRWLGCLIAFVLCLLMFVSVTKSYVNVIRHLTPDLIHQFGLRSVAFFALILAWVIFTPSRRSRNTSVKVRKLIVAIAVAVGLLQTLLAIQFLFEIWAATTTDQVRLAVRLLLYTGLALYLLALVRVFLPGSTYRDGATRVAGSSA
jgi:hypothetical protein